MLSIKLKNINERQPLLRKIIIIFVLHKFQFILFLFFFPFFLTLKQYSTSSIFATLPRDLLNIGNIDIGNNLKFLIRDTPKCIASNISIHLFEPLLSIIPDEKEEKERGRSVSQE